jgi:hypothetical protein
VPPGVPGPDPADALGGEPPSDALWRLLSGIEGSLAVAPGGDPVVFGVVGSPTYEPGHVELWWHVLPGGRHPADAVAGVRAPDDWLAIGAVCRGLARHLDRPCTGASDGPHDVLVVTAVERSGATATRLRTGDDVIETSEPPEGRLADALRCTFGLPTAPPPAGPLELWTAVWLDRLVEAAVVTPDDLRAWSAVTALHPGAPPGASGRPAPEPDGLVAVAAARAEAWPWRRLRTEAHAIDLGPAAPGPGVASWMDDGLFARTLLAGLPPIADLLATLDDLLPASLVARITATVAATSAVLAPGAGPAPASAPGRAAVTERAAAGREAPR